MAAAGVKRPRDTEMIYDQIVIERIEVRAVGPDVDRYSWASDLDQQYGTLTVVRMFDDQGFEGVGATPSYSTGRFDLAILETLRHLAPRVLGADPMEREAVWYGLQDLALEVLLGAHSALDIALWDIVAQRAGVPLHQLLGGSRKRLPAYASTPLLADADAYVAFVGELLERGFRAVKFHAWCEADRDLEMLRKVHDAHAGTGIRMMHDAEQRYDRVSALRVARELDAMGFAWLEAPLPDQDVEGYAELRRRTGVPIHRRRQHDPRPAVGLDGASPASVGRPAHRRHRGRRADAVPQADRTGRGRRALVGAAELGLHVDPGRQPPPRAGRCRHRHVRVPGAVRAA